MTIRKLRIAWSVFWGIACVLLVLLWVRSYSWNDWYFRRLGARDIMVQIKLGDIGVWLTPVEPNQVPADSPKWSIAKDRIVERERNYLMYDESQGTLTVKPVPGIFGFHYGSSPRATVAWAPFWGTLIFVVVAGSLPWFKRRFSLHTLLMATALVAVVLG